MARVEEQIEGQTTVDEQLASVESNGYEPVVKERQRKTNGERKPVEPRPYLLVDGELFEQAVIGTSQGLNGKLAVRAARDELALRGRKVVAIPPRNLGRYIG